MGKGRTTQATQQQTTQTTTPSPAPGEEQLTGQQQGLVAAGLPGQTQLAQNLPNLINMLLTGQNLPGFLAPLTQGISPQAIGTQAGRLARQNLAGFQSQGLADSGVAFRETAADIANRVLLPSEQFNLGNLFNLIGLGVTGGTQATQALLQPQQLLSQRLAGLRPVSGAGQQIGTTTVTAPNPFISSFQTSLGETFGSPTFIEGFGG